MRPPRKRSRGLQGIIAGVTSIVGIVTTAAPSIIPYLDPEPAKVLGIITALAGAVVAAFSKPPRLPLLNEGDHHGDL